MKRRDFLALLSTAGAGAVLLKSPGLTPGATLARHRLASGYIGFSHRRQGYGYPVTVTLHLPNMGGYTGSPEPLIVREGAEDWFDLVGQATSLGQPENDTWVWSWTPPPVKPSAEEQQTELIRYRLAILNEEDRSIGLVSEALEVVCAHRVWGA